MVRMKVGVDGGIHFRVAGYTAGHGSRCRRLHLANVFCERLRSKEIHQHVM